MKQVSFIIFITGASVGSSESIMGGFGCRGSVADSS